MEMICVLPEASTICTASMIAPSTAPATRPQTTVLMGKGAGVVPGRCGVRQPSASKIPKGSTSKASTSSFTPQVKLPPQASPGPTLKLSGLANLALSSAPETRKSYGKKLSPR